MKPLRLTRWPRGARAVVQRGLTLLEMMVAMAITLVVVLAALAALLFAREGFATIDTASQLSENARFLTELVTRVVVQAGYRDVATTAMARNSTGFNVQPPDIGGFDNSVVTALGTVNPTLASSVAARSASTCGAADTSCVNYSDMLVVSYQGHNNPAGTPDGSMIDCTGNSIGHNIANVDQDASDAISVFHVKRSTSGEPVLMCASNGSGAWQTSPLITGVESFQVLYGVDGVTPNVAYTPPAVGTIVIAKPPSRWLRADQLVVSGNAVGTANNWRQVTDVRIGIVLRSAVTQGSAVATTVFPFAEGASSVLSSTAGTATGQALAVPADRRVRQTLSFTVHLRNSLN